MCVHVNLENRAWAWVLCRTVHDRTRWQHGFSQEAHILIFVHTHQGPLKNTTISRHPIKSVWALHSLIACCSHFSLTEYRIVQLQSTPNILHPTKILMFSCSGIKLHCAAKQLHLTQSIVNEINSERVDYSDFLQQWCSLSFISLCIGVSISAVSIRDQLSFLAGVARLLNNWRLNVCGETKRQWLVSLPPSTATQELLPVSHRHLDHSESPPPGRQGRHSRDPPPPLWALAWASHSSSCSSNRGSSSSSSRSGSRTVQTIPETDSSFSTGRYKRAELPRVFSPTLAHHVDSMK